MTISIKINNPYLMNRAHNYFYNKNVQTMLCNNETELTLFNLERTEAELLLNAFTKHFHLNPDMQHPLAAWSKIEAKMKKVGPDFEFFPACSYVINRPGLIE